MGREHVVVGRDNGDVGLHVALERLLVVHIAGGEAMRQVAAGKRRAFRSALRRLPDTLEVDRARLRTTFGDAFGYSGHARMDGHEVCSSSKVGAYEVRKPRE